MVDAMGMYFNLGNLNWGILGSNKLVKNHDRYTLSTYAFYCRRTYDM